MIRAFLCVAVALTISVGLGSAAEKKGAAVAGTVKKIDAVKGVITVAVKNKKETMDKEFTITEATKFTILVGDDKREMVGKDGLKSEQLKEGAHVTITADETGKVSEIKIGMAKKK